MSQRMCMYLCFNQGMFLQFSIFQDQGQREAKAIWHLLTVWQMASLGLFIKICVALFTAGTEGDQNGLDHPSVEVSLDENSGMLVDGFERTFDGKLKCRYCNYASKGTARLIEHIRIHTGMGSSLCLPGRPWGIYSALGFPSQQLANSSCSSVTWQGIRNWAGTRGRKGKMVFDFSSWTHFRSFRTCRPGSVTPRRSIYQGKIRRPKVLPYKSVGWPVII